ncbi:unnamed protein product [Brassica oleracea var. botrytis]|uniref:(rape) hypothetical protein n=1 Tax=Brassica napus TaxID=3708 RepID=A0A078H689_BRANA|nr:unnamed protein product [Brassica napus]CDY33386.1 BnaC05g11970D [Brassica napus]
MEISVTGLSSIDNGIGSWDLKTGTEQLRFKQCASPAHGLTAVGDKFLAASQLRNASGSSGSIFFWSWNKPQAEVKSFPLESITALAANMEGTYIVGGGASGDIFLWEVSSGKLLKKWHGHDQSVTCLLFSGDDSLLVSGSKDGYVRVWSLIRLFDDIQRQQQGSTFYEHDFNEHTTSVTDIVIDYGGCNALLVTASEDCTCKVWSLSKGKLLRNIIFPAAINALALNSYKHHFSMLVIKIAKFISVP